MPPWSLIIKLFNSVVDTGIISVIGQVTTLFEVEQFLEVESKYEKLINDYYLISFKWLFTGQLYLNTS